MSSLCKFAWIRHCFLSHEFALAKMDIYFVVCSLVFTFVSKWLCLFRQFVIWPVNRPSSVTLANWYACTFEYIAFIKNRWWKVQFRWKIVIIFKCSDMSTGFVYSTVLMVFVLGDLKVHISQYSSWDLYRIVHLYRLRTLFFGDVLSLHLQ